MPVLDPLLVKDLKFPMPPLASLKKWTFGSVVPRRWIVAFEVKDRVVLTVGTATDTSSRSVMP